jgi:hypothetical protein
MDFGQICPQGHEYPSYKESCSVCWAEEVRQMADQFPGWELNYDSPPGIIIGKCRTCGDESEPPADKQCPSCNLAAKYPDRKPIQTLDGKTIISCQARHVLCGEKYELYSGCPLCKLATDAVHIPQQSYIYGEDNCIVVKKGGKVWVNGGDKHYVKALMILSAVGLRNSYARYMYQVDTFIGSPTENIWLIVDSYSLPMDGMRAWSVCSKSGKEILANICEILGCNYDKAANKYKQSKKDCTLDLANCRVKDMTMNLETKYKPNAAHDFLGRMH